METSEQLQKAQQAFEKGNYDYTIEVLDHLLSASPASVEARHLLHLAKQSRAKTLSPFEKIVHSLMAIPCLISAKMTASKGDPGKTIEAYERVLSIDPLNTPAVMAIAHLLIAEKQLAAAEQTLLELHSALPNQIAVLRQLAQIYLLGDQHSKARQCFEQVLKIDPKNSEAERNIKNLDAMDAIRGMREETQGQ